MSKVDAMIQSIHDFFYQKGEEQGMTPEEIECLLGDINYMQVYQAAKNRSRTVYKYEIDSIIPDEFEYRSQWLFPCPATKIYEIPDWGAEAADVFELEHAIELWLLDDMRLVSVSSCTVFMDEGDYTSVYREMKCDGWPLGEAPVDLDEVAARFHRLEALRENAENITWHES